MASTSLSLNEHWQAFINHEIETGRYASASEVVRAALHELEEKGERLTALRAHLAEGADQAARGEFVVDFDIDKVIAQAISAA